MACSRRPTLGQTRSLRCFLYMQVKDGSSSVFHPTKVNTFDCSPSYATNLHDDFGGGAKLKGG